MQKKFIVETSARHVHVTEEHLKALFGEDAQFTVKKNLSQPGQYASNQQVLVEGPRGSLRFSILGPCRPATQVEVSLTDARILGIAAPVRESGFIEGSPGAKLIGPAGEIEISEGVIAARRHLHATPEDAQELGISDGQIVSVKVNTPERSLVFGDVVVRVNKNYALSMHIDTDEANAAGLSGNGEGEII
ncbi:MAG: phosphate propanoyltransferase [Oscillospiraceae bacterium]|nr:phosphate propanoyltransferase [Oscillospiraceae bacterium]